MASDPKMIPESDAHYVAILCSLTAGVMTPAFLWLCGVVDFHAPSQWVLRIF